MKLTTNNQILLDQIIESELRDYESFSRKNDFFEFFAPSLILKDYDLSDDEIINGMTGQGGDGGIDGFYLLVNEELVTEDQIEDITIPRGAYIDLILIQTKYTSSFGEDVIMKWKTTSENLLNISDFDEFKNRYNDRIIENFRLFGELIKRNIRQQCKIRISFFYVTLGSIEELHPNLLDQRNELIALVNKIYPSATVNVSFWGADTLMSAYQRSPHTEANLTLKELPISLGADGLVALINLDTYYKFITDEEGNLIKRYFEANVRDYQGKNSVNKSIAESLSNDSNEDFWWLNNGVTILTTKINFVTNKELIIENPEIVNGLQTSREIYNYFTNNQERLNSEGRNVLVRIIKPNDDNSRDRIIYATNNQTNIPQYSLRVTDPIHIQIELYLKGRGLYYDRRKNYYKNQQKKPADIIGVAFLAQCLISLVRKQPDYARARPSTLLANDEIYQELYSGDKDLAVYYNAAMIGKKVKVYLNTTELSRSAKNDILFYVIYVVVAKCIQKKDISFDDIKNFDINQITDEVIQDAIDLVYNKYEEKGATGSVAKSPDFINDIDDELIFD